MTFNQCLGLLGDLKDSCFAESTISEQQERGELDTLQQKAKESIFLQSPPGI